MAYGPADYRSPGYVNANNQATNIRNKKVVKRGRGSYGLKANIFTLFSIACGLLALLFMPMYLGIAGIALGIAGIVHRERRPGLGIVISIIGLVVGVAWAILSAKFGLHI